MPDYVFLINWTILWERLSNWGKRSVLKGFPVVGSDSSVVLSLVSNFVFCYLFLPGLCEHEENLLIAFGIIPREKLK